MRSKLNLPAEANLYVILDTAVNAPAELIAVAESCAGAGVDVLQLRDKAGNARETLELAVRLRQTIRGRALYIVNDRVDIALAAEAGGVHLGQDDFPVAAARTILGPGAVIGVSCQNFEHARKAAADGADYIGFGSVFKTLTKPDRRPMDLSLLEKVCREVEIPVFAIGGIRLDNIAPLRDRGVSRFAVCRDVCLADDPGRAARKYKETISGSLLPGTSG